MGLQRVGHWTTESAHSINIRNYCSYSLSLRSPVAKLWELFYRSCPCIAIPEFLSCASPPHSRQKAKALLTLERGVFSYVVGRGCLLWSVCSLGRTLLAFALLHSVLQGQICLLLQVFLDFLLLRGSRQCPKLHCWIGILESKMDSVVGCTGKSFGWSWVSLPGKWKEYSMAGLSNFIVSVDHLGLLLYPCLESAGLNRVCHSAFFMNINYSQIRPVHGLRSKEWGIRANQTFGEWRSPGICRPMVELEKWGGKWSEEKVAQSCPTLCDCMDSMAFSRPVGSLSLLQGSSQPRDQTQVSHIAGGFFISWATREAQE